jgi:hypothetical protein
MRSQYGGDRDQYTPLCRDIHNILMSLIFLRTHLRIEESILHAVDYRIYPSYTGTPVIDELVGHESGVMMLLIWIALHHGTFPPAGTKPKGGGGGQAFESFMSTGRHHSLPAG